jgi:hypothetical protein
VVSGGLASPEKREHEVAPEEWTAGERKLIEALREYPVRNLSADELEQALNRLLEKRRTVPLRALIVVGAVAVVAGAIWMMIATTRGSNPRLAQEPAPAAAGLAPRPGSTEEAAPDGFEILPRAHRGEYFNPAWKAKSIYFDFYLDDPVRVHRGDVVRMEYSLEHSDVLGIQLRPKGQDPNERGDMQIRRSAGGRNRVVDVTVPSDREIAQIAFQIGEYAYGPLGGSMDAEFTVSSIRVLPLDREQRPRTTPRLRGSIDSGLSRPY